MASLILDAGYWGSVVLAIGLDVAIKATLLLILAYGLNGLLGRRRTLIRSAMWNAVLIVLVLLPFGAVAFPRLRLNWLPAAPAAEVVPVNPAGRALVPAQTQPAAVALNNPQELPGILEDLTALYEKTIVSPRRFDLPPHVDPEAEADAPEPALGPVALLPDKPPTMPAASIAVSSARSWTREVVLIYLGGATALLVRLVISLLAVRRLRRRAITLLDPEWIRARDAWCEQLGIRRPVKLAVLDRVYVPVTVGWRRPMILVPIWLNRPGKAGHRDTVLLHELMHVRRCDYAWQVLLCFLQVVYWPHPLIWMLSRVLTGGREQACDECTLHFSRSRDAYKSTLLEVAAELSQAGAAAGARMGASMARPGSIERRLNWIERGYSSVSPQAGERLRLLLLLLAIAGGATLAATQLNRKQLASVGALLSSVLTPTGEPGPSTGSDADAPNAPLSRLAFLVQRGKEERAQGHPDRAATCFEAALKEAEQLGADHPDVAECLKELATVSQTMTDCRRALAIQEKTLGADHPELVVNLIRLAQAGCREGEYEQAGKLGRRALEISEKHLGRDHPDVAVALNCLALVYTRQRQYEQAETLCRRALVIVEKARGPDHIAAIESLMRLCQLYAEQDDRDQARATYRQALAIDPEETLRWLVVVRLGAFTPDEPAVQQAVARLRPHLLGQARFDFAEGLCRQVLAMQKKASVTGNADRKPGPLPVEPGARLAGYRQVDTASNRGKGSKKGIVSSDDLFLAWSLAERARLYEHRDEYDQAKLGYERAMTLSEQALGSNHPRVMECALGLANVCAQLRDYEQAESLYKKALAIEEEILAHGGAVPLMANALESYGDMLNRSGRPAEATPLYTRAAQIRKTGGQATRPATSPQS